MTREYGQYCGLARALELVGGRWSMLIVRELLAGPKRFTQLAQGLPGIPTNVLSSRLRELEDDGVVQRALQPGRSTAVVYELTSYGLELEEPVARLGLWGAKALGKPTSDVSFSGAALQLALRATFDPDAAEGADFTAEIRFDGEGLLVRVTEGKLEFPAEPASPPHLVIETAPHVFAELFAGDIEINSAIGAGQVRVEGPKREARRFFDIFRLPRAGAEPASRHAPTK
jgi:DNA-binding HxlR family transcriptional regulator/putative sterol carrier protein